MINWICGIGWAGLLLWPLWFKYRRDQGFSQLDDSDGIVVKEHWRIISYLWGSRRPSWFYRVMDSRKNEQFEEFYTKGKPRYVTDGRGNTAIKTDRPKLIRKWLKEQNLL